MKSKFFLAFGLLLVLSLGLTSASGYTPLGDELLDSSPSGYDLSAIADSHTIASGKFGEALTGIDARGYAVSPNAQQTLGPQGHPDPDTHHRTFEFWLKLAAEQFDVDGNFQIYGGQTSRYVNLVRGNGGIGFNMTVGTNQASLWDSWSYPPSTTSPLLTWQADTWYHLAFDQEDSVGIDIWRDGVLVKAGTGYHNARFSNPQGSLYLGDYIGYKKDGLVGQMDEFRISNSDFSLNGGRWMSSYSGSESDTLLLYHFDIPEPATMCLLGLGSLALLRRRRA